MSGFAGSLPLVSASAMRERRHKKLGRSGEASLSACSIMMEREMSFAHAKPLR